jgi:hypothetical protein
MIIHKIKHEKERKIIDNWSLVHDNTVMYNDELLDSLPKIRYTDGEHDILTTPVRKLDIASQIAETSDMIYILGEPNSEFLRWVKRSGKPLEGYDKYDYLDYDESKPNDER